jgi:hypothetical protein
MKNIPNKSKPNITNLTKTTNFKTHQIKAKFTILAYLFCRERDNQTGKSMCALLPKLL